MSHPPFAQLRNHPVVRAADALLIGDWRVPLDATLACGASIGPVAIADLAQAAAEIEQLSAGTCAPQLAALVFAATGRVRALDGYFPLLNALDDIHRDNFYQLAGWAARHPHLALRLFGAGGVDLTARLPIDARWIVAGHLAEVFYFRRDILERLFATPRPILLYATPGVFAEAGGVAGGCYNPADGSIQLVLARLYEGFYGDAPGVAPFLHEFGHMLDAFDAATGAAGQALGLLPGMHPRDGALYTPQARARFLRGKGIELERYLQRYHGQQRPGDTPPFGHPYVFQSDGEFLAGYFELFFRCPHAFAAHNPDLYQGFVELLHQDQRQAWARDFDGYLNENRAFYAGNERPWPPGLTLDDG